ncbi:MAG TPA: type I glyceraldehyde-3-phosphate dehydrogenase [Planctomycetota bacterium]|nr:type I glyceraldehyde-3-phosphate dehydrogenase [Planctomycetota bacterium]
MPRVAINGFGRIGRTLLRCAKDSDLDIVAVNDIAPFDNLAYLLKYDSVYRTWDDVSIQGDRLTAGRWSIKMFNEKDPAALPWKDMDIDIVLECSGIFLDREGASRHLKAGAGKVLLSAPAKDAGADATIVLGVNWHIYDPEKHHIVSNASCTTNCAAVVAKVLHDAFGIQHAFLSTAHAYTASQKVVDSPDKKWRRGRAAAESIVPTSTGAAKALALVIPALSGRLHASALRVPVVCGSIIDFVVQTDRPVSVGSVNKAFQQASDSDAMKGLLNVSSDELVSADIIGDSASARVDLQSTAVLGDHLVRVAAWYDNEWGYCCRLRDLAIKVGERIAAPAPA